MAAISAPTIKNVGSTLVVHYALNVVAERIDQECEAVLPSEASGHW